MCPYTLDHNKMLASTMQHSTHNHTPTPPQPPHRTTHALDQPAQERHQEKHPPNHTGVSSGPNSVPSHRPRRPEHARNQAAEVFHPATPTTRHHNSDRLPDQA